jgi:hypothetical protein
MKNRLTVMSFVLLFFSCSTTKTVSFKLRGNDGQKFNYQMRIPKGYTVREMDFENERAKVFLYPDSSRLFFSDNVKPSAFYPQAYKKYGKDLNLNFLTNDTITINGTDEAGNFWEERKAQNVVYGYMKVSLEKKGMFDSILNNLIKK